MGNRGNVRVVFADGKGTTSQQAINIYTHNDGCEIANAVKHALSNEANRYDPTLLAQAIVGYLIKGRHGLNLMVSREQYESDHHLIDVNPMRQQVMVTVPRGQYGGVKSLRTWSFVDFLAASAADVDQLLHGGADGIVRKWDEQLPKILWKGDFTEHQYRRLAQAVPELRSYFDSAYFEERDKPYDPY